MRTITVGSLMLVVGSLLASPAQAQVYIRAPFVRVQVGGGVYVRAPFVNLYVPPSPRVYYMEPQTIVAPPVFVPPAPTALENPAPLDEPTTPSVPVRPMPPADDDPDSAPPVPSTPQRLTTLAEFVKAFQPKAGSYEVTLMNPVTRQATTVQFTLPEGAPRRVHVRGNEIEFDYGPRRYVKIQFDRDGAEVVSR